MNKSEVLIIGSGFGGAVAADRLCGAGASVVLLERGPWRDTASNRDASIGPRSSLPYGWKFYTHFLRNLQFGGFGSVTANARGSFEVFLNKGVSVVCSSGVGGGSHIYTALNEKPRIPGYWDGHHEAVSDTSLEGHYARVMDEMAGTRLGENDALPNSPDQIWRDVAAFECEAASRQMRNAAPFPGGTPIAERTEGGMLGSQHGNKHTLDSVYLRKAIARGLCIRDMTEAVGVYKLDKGQGARFRVEAYDHSEGRLRSYFADRVLLGAGTLNTLRLLLRSRDANRGLDGMPALGKRFGTNTDALAMWRINRKDCDFLAGLPCHGELALREPVKGDEVANFIQVGLVGFQHAKLPPFLVRYLRHNLLLVGYSTDRADGIAVWKRGRLRIEYHADRSPSYDVIRRSFAEFARYSRAPITGLPFTLTVHPLGGAALGSDDRSGVVDHRGEVYGHPGLYVVDGAALPRSPGVPPSMSIAAWSSHVAENLARDSLRPQEVPFYLSGLQSGALTANHRCAATVN